MRNGAKLLAIFLSVAAILAIVAWQGHGSRAKTVTFHLNRLKVLERVTPHVDIGFRDCFRPGTWWWLLAGRPAGPVLGDEINNHFTALRNNGYFVHCRFSMTNGPTDSQFWADFHGALSQAKLVHRQYQLYQLGDDPTNRSALFVTACTSDIPVFETIFRQLDKPSPKR